MKLNCDLGESFGHWTKGLDEQAMAQIDQANIACGFHAGDPMVLANTLRLAKQYNVEVGAHPSYPDLAGFGRRSMALSANELRQTLHYQIAAIVGMASVQDLTVSYVKPHGALYNDMMKDRNIRATVMRAVADYPQPLALMLQGTPNFEDHQQQAREVGVKLLFEAFADRCYGDDGLLLNRQQPGAVLDESAMLKQVDGIVARQEIITQNQQRLCFPIDSLCVHGDNPTGVAQLTRIRQVVHPDDH